jgi:hypothetical protein
MRVFLILRPIAFTLEKLLPKICRKSGQAHPDAREMFRAFFVAAGAKRKTIKLSVRSLCTTARSTDPEVGYKPQSPLKLEYIRQENGTPQIARFSAKWITFRLPVTREQAGSQKLSVRVSVPRNAYRTSRYWPSAFGTAQD